MQLSEVKNDIAKIIYNPAENHLLPSDFLLIEDLNQKLISLKEKEIQLAVDVERVAMNGYQLEVLMSWLPIEP